MNNNYKYFEWQQDIINDLGTKNGLIVLPPGTGKTIIAIHYLLRCPGKVLIISSKYVLHQYITDYLQNEDYLLWKNKKQKIHNHKIILCSYGMIGRKDNYGWLLEHPFDLIIIDEAHHLQNRQSHQTQNIFKICAANLKKQVILMTATPFSEGNESQIQPLMECIDPLSKVGYHKVFKALFIRKEMVAVGRGKKLVPVHKMVHKELFLKFCEPYIYPKKKYDFHLPQQIFKDIKLSMPDELKEKYLEAKNTCSLYLEEHDFSMFFTAGIWQKLLQIGCGFVYDPLTHVPIDLSSDKIEQLEEMLPEMIEDKKCLIFSSYPVEIKKVYEQISKTYRCDMIFGGMPSGKVCKTIEDFKHGDLQVLVANPECIGEGMSFECCSRQIFLSISPRGLVYTQAIGRTNRITQKNQEIIFRVYYNMPEIVKLMMLVPEKGLKEMEILKRIFLK